MNTMNASVGNNISNLKYMKMNCIPKHVANLMHMFFSSRIIILLKRANMAQNKQNMSNSLITWAWNLTSLLLLDIVSLLKEYNSREAQECQIRSHFFWQVPPDGILSLLHYSLLMRGDLLRILITNASTLWCCFPDSYIYRKCFCQEILNFHRANDTGYITSCQLDPHNYNHW